MTRGRKAILTRQQIMDHLDKLMLEKHLDKESIPKGGLLFKWYMSFPSEQRPPISGLADMYHMHRNYMQRLIERWEQDNK